jgi:hypothetical protein
MFSSIMSEAQPSADDSLKNYIYSNTKQNPYDFTKGNLIVHDEKGNVIFDQTKGVANIDLYEKYTAMAHDLNRKKQYYPSRKLYERALIVNLGKAKVKDRYDLAKCYMSLNMPYSAFSQLITIAEKSKYYNVYEINAEPLFQSLKTDPRWKRVQDGVSKNNQEIEKGLNNELPQIRH